MLTGDRPTGPLHLGHWYGSLAERLTLQEDPNFDCFVLLADAQAYTDHADRPETVRENVYEVMLDYLAVGLDPEKTTIYVQTGVPEIHELAIYFANLVTWKRLVQNPTVRQEMDQKGMVDDGAPTGFVIYPIHQAADILVVKGEIVPVGDDQNPMLELAAFIARRFNQVYGEVFPVPRSITPLGGRLPGIDGKAKASKTLKNAIFLSDEPELVATRVRAMYTDPRKTSVAAPGHVDGHVPFAYLDAFAEDVDYVADLKERYEAGGLADSAIKAHLVEVLDEKLAPVRSRRLEYAKDPAEVWRTLQRGTEKARETAVAVMEEVRRTMKLDYFS